MSALEVRRHPNVKKAGKKPTSVTTRRLTTDAGDKVTVRVVDANSPTFGEDFLYVFSKNVEAARRENKAVLGTPSGFRKRS